MHITYAFVCIQVVHTWYALTSCTICGTQTQKVFPKGSRTGEQTRTGKIPKATGHASKKTPNHGAGLSPQVLAATYACGCTHAYVHMCIRTYAWTHAHTCTCTHRGTCIYMNTCTHEHEWTGAGISRAASGAGMSTARTTRSAASSVKSSRTEAGADGPVSGEGIFVWRYLCAFVWLHNACLDSLFHLICIMLVARSLFCLARHTIVVCLSGHRQKHHHPTFSSHTYRHVAV
jgi:hypothetical protein